jgi:integrase
VERLPGLPRITRCACWEFGALKRAIRGTRLFHLDSAVQSAGHCGSGSTVTRKPPRRRYANQTCPVLARPAAGGGPACFIVEEPLHPPQEHALRRLPLPLLPLRQRAGVNAKALGGLLLGKPQARPVPDQLLGQRVRRRKRVVAQEPDDRGHIPDLRAGPIPLPVKNAGLVHTELFRDFSLQQFQPQPPLPDVVADGLRRQRNSDYSPSAVRLGQREWHRLIRLRARAMVLLMRYTGMRISDVVTLSRDHIKGIYLEKRAVKNHRQIRVELPIEVLKVLECLPHPKAAAQDSKLFFSGGNASLRSLVKGAERTMAAVFKRSGVAHAHCHRFRHTLASELLARPGVTMEDVAGILGDTTGTIERHYAKWTPARQARQDEALRRVHGTNLAQTEDGVARC